MSFILDVKNEIINSKINNYCCQLATMYGLVLSCGSISKKSGSFCLEFGTSNGDLFTFLNQIVDKLYGEYALMEVDEDSLANRTNYIITLSEVATKKLLEDLEILQNGSINFDINENVFNNDCCAINFLKGVFLACASSSIKLGEEGQAGYHIELAFSNEDLAYTIADILASLGVIERLIHRGENVIVYLSDYDSILTLVGLLGASKSYLKLENENASRDLKKQINRELNFVNANLNKQSEVAGKQINAIKEIDRIVGLNTLPFELKELAQARLDNPQDSLESLNQHLSKPITKSGINHRMRKIMKIYENLKG